MTPPEHQVDLVTLRLLGFTGVTLTGSPQRTIVGNGLTPVPLALVVRYPRFYAAYLNYFDMPAARPLGEDLRGRRTRGGVFRTRLDALLHLIADYRVDVRRRPFLRSDQIWLHPGNDPISDIQEFTQVVHETTINVNILDGAVARSKEAMEELKLSIDKLLSEKIDRAFVRGRF